MFIIYQSCVSSAIFGLYYEKINAALKEQTIKPTDHFCQFQYCLLSHNVTFTNNKSVIPHKQQG